MTRQTFMDFGSTHKELGRRKAAGSEVNVR